MFKNLHFKLIIAEWYSFIGRQAAPNLPGSPYAIIFRSNATDSSGMVPMNVSTYSCGDNSLGCSCGDCPSSTACSNTAAPVSPKKGSCSVKIGSIKVKAHTLEYSIFGNTEAHCQTTY